MRFALLLRALLAIAVVLAASLTAPAAMAMPQPAPMHHAAAMKASHCAQMPMPDSGAPKHHEGKAGKSCCAATCLATATFFASAIEPLDTSGDEPSLAAVKSFHGLIAEIATPPPRIA